MQRTDDRLQPLGWNAELGAAFSGHADSGLIAGRIALEHTHIYRVLTADGDLLARVAGRIRHHAGSRADFPAVGVAFKRAIAEVDAVLFVTPEYNRSIPGGLKNAIDWASRPYGKNSFTRKPSAVIGTSPGAIGTAVAQQSLRSVLSFCNSPQMNAPEAYIQFKPGLISAEGEVSDESTETFLRDYMQSLHAFIVRVLTVLPRAAME